MILHHFRKILLFKVCSLLLGGVLLAWYVLGQDKTSEQPRQIVIVQHPVNTGALARELDVLSKQSSGPIGVIGGSDTAQRIVAPTLIYDELAAQTIKLLALQGQTLLTRSQILNFASSQANPNDIIREFQDNTLQQVKGTLVQYVDTDTESSYTALLLALIFILLGL